MGRHKNSLISPDQRRPVDNKLSHPEALKLVLFQPRIPQNTGSIARLCAATGSKLDLINPLFELDDKRMKRAGLDYWHLLDVRVYESFEAWNKENPTMPWLVEVKAPQSFTDVSFQKAEALMFGDEQEGIPQELLKDNAEKHIALPQQGVRSLNLAMSVGIVCYEALRQLNYYSIKNE